MPGFVPGAGKSRDFRKNCSAAPGPGSRGRSPSYTDGLMEPHTGRQQFSSGMKTRVMDILQDSYVKAFRNLHQLREADKFRAWMKRIVHNSAVDWLRKRKPVIFSEMSYESESAAGDSGRPDMQSSGCCY